MANRLNVTTATGESAIWSPVSESILQLDAEDPAAKVEIQARCDATASWFTVERLINQQRVFTRLPKFPFLKAVIISNTATKAVKIWDNL